MGIGPKKKKKKSLNKPGKDQARDQTRRQLAGSAVLSGDMETASKSITASICESLARSAREVSEG